MSHIVQPLRQPVVDALERWESPVGAEVATSDAHRLADRPYVPLAWEEVPDGAADALEEACGAWRLDQLFVIPAVARMVAALGIDWVATPTQVLGLADRGVALWVDTKRIAGVQLAMALDELAAIEQIQIGPNVRLSFLARNRHLTVRYSALAAHDVERALAAVRAAAFGYPATVSPEPPPPMPPAWAHVAHSLAARLRPCDPALLRFVGPSEEVESPGGTLLALTPGELVIAREPDPDRLGNAPACGPDLLHVLRRCLQGAERTDTGVRVHAGGVELEVPVTRSLADDLLGLVEQARGGAKATDHDRSGRATDDAAA